MYADASLPAFSGHGWYHGRMGQMDESDFDGTLVLEKLAAKELVEDFFDAVDADDFGRASSLMKTAEVDAETIRMLLKKMADGARD